MPRILISIKEGWFKPSRGGITAQGGALWGQRLWGPLTDVFTGGRQQFIKPDQDVMPKQLLFWLKPLSRSVNGQRTCREKWKGRKKEKVLNHAAVFSFSTLLNHVSPSSAALSAVNIPQKQTKCQRKRVFRIVYANVCSSCPNTSLLSIPSSMLLQNSSDLLPVDTQQTCPCLLARACAPACFRALSAVQCYTTQDDTFH